MARRLFFRIIALIVVLALAGGAVIAFRGVGRWLVRPDAPAPAQVIVILSGGMPSRAEEAARIFRLGDAREVWVSQPVAPTNELAEMGIRYLGEDYFNREVLVYEGVPDVAIRIMPDAIVDTQQEVEEIVRLMRREEKMSVIIVTSPQHTRRVKALWHKLAGDKLRAIVCAAPQDPFDADHWWRNTRDTFSVVREVLGLLNVWAGLPVRPNAR
jgi:uncharacterized SAM-binding protein YcdF (DUF218 family)